LAAHVDSGKPLPAGAQELELRAVSVHVCSEIVKLAKLKFKDHPQIGTFNDMLLDYYLWNLGKDPEFRKLDRHYTQDTVFY
jgi:hypothetical protein